MPSSEQVKRPATTDDPISTKDSLIACCYAFPADPAALRCSPYKASKIGQYDSNTNHLPRTAQNTHKLSTIALECL